LTPPTSSSADAGAPPPPPSASAFFASASSRSSRLRSSSSAVDPRLDLLGRRAQRSGDRLERVLAPDQPLPRGFAGQRLDPPHARADRALGDDPQQARCRRSRDVGAAAQLDRVASPAVARVTHRQHTHFLAVLLAEQRHRPAAIASSGLISRV
jgi:hypothetical protein